MRTAKIAWRNYHISQDLTFLWNPNLFRPVPYIPVVKWIHFDPCYSSPKSFCEGYQRKWGIRKSEKKCRFVKKLRNNGYFWAFKSLLNIKMNINVNVCPSGVPKIQISNPKSIHIENETLFFIHGHFAMPTCEINKGSRKRN